MSTEQAQRVANRFILATTKKRDIDALKKLILGGGELPAIQKALQKLDKAVMGNWATLGAAPLKSDLKWYLDKPERRKQLASNLEEAFRKHQKS